MKHKKLILILIFVILFALNFLFDYFFRKDNIDILRNFSVALGVTIGIGIVYKVVSK